MTQENRRVIRDTVFGLLRQRLEKREKIIAKSWEYLKVKGIPREEFEEWWRERFPSCPKCGFGCSSTFMHCPECGTRLPLPKTIEQLDDREEEMVGYSHIAHHLQKADGLNFCVDCGKKL